MPSTSAISSVANPPKKRSSTMRPCCSSSLESPVNASSNATMSAVRICGTTSDVSSSTLRSAPRLGGSATAGMVDEDLPHQARCHGQKVGPVLRVEGPLVQQAQVGLMHQC